MTKLICHDCGIDCDLYTSEGHNRAGGELVTCCSECWSKREDELSSDEEE